MNKKLTKLEAIRGLSAVYVVLGHTFTDVLKQTAPLLSYMLRFGQEAVILFFILSGFVIHYSYEKAANKSFKLFFLKRFLRIYIPLILVFIANYALLSVYSKELYAVDANNLIGNLFMFQDAPNLKTNTICGTFLGNSPLWSLSYEWWFYMLYFFIRNYFPKNSNEQVYVIGVLAALTYLVYPNFLNRILMYLLVWWIGVEMASLYLKNITITFKSLQLPLIVLSICVVILITNIPLNYVRITKELGIKGTIGESPWLELRHFSFALVAIAIAILWKRYHWIWFDRSIGVFEPIAKISFALYISHWFLLAKAEYLDFLHLPYVFKIVIYSIVTILFSYSVEILIYPKLNKWIMSLIYNPNSELKTSNAHTHIRN